MFCFVWLLFFQAFTQEGRARSITICSRLLSSCGLAVWQLPPPRYQHTLNHSHSHKENSKQYTYYTYTVPIPHQTHIYTQRFNHPHLNLYIFKDHIQLASHAFLSTKQKYRIKQNIPPNSDIIKKKWIQLRRLPVSVASPFVCVCVLLAFTIRMIYSKRKQQMHNYSFAV